LRFLRELGNDLLLTKISTHATHHLLSPELYKNQQSEPTQHLFCHQLIRFQISIDKMVVALHAYLPD
jgi:hypothetical protein